MKKLIYFCSGLIFGIVSSRVLGLPLWLELIVVLVVLVVLVVVGGLYLLDKKNRSIE